MVSSKDRRNDPKYSLERVRELAARGAVRYVSRTVQHNVEDLEYAPEEVHLCLQTLDRCHFRHAERYSETGAWLDVYQISYRGPTGIDELYVKLKLNRDCTVVILHSFHLKRYG